MSIRSEIKIIILIEYFLSLCLNRFFSCVTIELFKQRQNFESNTFLFSLSAFLPRDESNNGFMQNIFFITDMLQGKETIGWEKENIFLQKLSQ